MNEERINAIKDALRELIQIITQRDQPLDAELRAMLGQVMEHAATRIQELRQEGVPPPEVPDLTDAMPSSNISRFAYNDNNNELYVQFLGKHPNRDGPVYSYQGVPKVIFDLFRQGAIPARTKGRNRWGEWWRGKVPSIGASMFTLIKNAAYPYTRVA